MKRLRIPQTADPREVLAAFRDMATLLEAIGDIPLLDGVLITGTKQTDGSLTDGIALSAGVGKAFAHGLGRRWRGFIPVKVYAGSGAGVINSDSGYLYHDPTKDLYLYSSTSTTVHVWVY